MGLRANLYRTVLADLPKADSVLTEPSDRWDLLQGGRKDANNWGRYSRGYGTNCAVVVDGWLIDVKAPSELINAKPEDGGSGFTIGDHIARLIKGAKSLGWYRTPKKGELPTFRPGDVYRINHQTTDGTDGSHVGIILSVKSNDDGSLTVETADGGQGTRQLQSAKRNIRTFKIGKSGHAVDVQSPSGPGWLEDWVAIGGDEEDDLDGGEPGGAVPTESSIGVYVTGAALAGVGFLLVGLALYATPVAGSRIDINCLATDPRFARWV